MTDDISGEDMQNQPAVQAPRYPWLRSSCQRSSRLAKPPAAVRRRLGWGGKAGRRRQRQGSPADGSGPANGGTG